MNKLLISIILLPFQVLCQSTISGTICNSETNEAIEYATIYINGTSIGTISDSNGVFCLKGIPKNSEIIFSSIAYKTQLLKPDENFHWNESIVIKLIPEKYQLGEVVITNENLRNKNLEYFHKNMFGQNKWGDYSFLENDSVLIFHSENYSDHDSTRIHQDYPDLFEAKAIAPLIIKLPLLGYDVFMNLIEFKVIYNPQTNQFETYCKAYSYYKIVENKSALKQNKIRKNRLNAYFNSKQHFLRSLYQQELKENGYLVVKETNNNNFLVTIYEIFPIDSFMHFNENYVDIIGLKDEKIKVVYCKKTNYQPLNLNQHRSDNNLSSGLCFLKDTCRIWPNGSASGQSIMFGPAIGDKKIGALLPEDYIPETTK